jgi:hypothetical protein
MHAQTQGVVPWGRGENKIHHRFLKGNRSLYPDILRVRLSRAHFLSVLRSQTPRWPSYEYVCISTITRERKLRDQTESLRNERHSIFFYMLVQAVSRDRKTNLP